MPKVNEIFINSEIDLAKGEHLNFSSLVTLDHLKLVLLEKAKRRISLLAPRSRFLTSKKEGVP